MPINQVQQSNANLLDILSELIATGNYYDGAVLHLCQGAVPTGPGVVVGDFTECNFSNYTASGTITWGAAFISPSNIPTVAGDAKSFNTGATPTVYNTVTGWYATNAAGTAVLFWRQLDVPIVLSVANQGFDIVPAIPAYLAS